MRVTYRRPAGRGGFTLIELLIVIAIIAILVSLVAAGVFKFVMKGDEVTNFSDIRQLDVALTNFKTAFGTSNPPSVIKLCEKYWDYDLTSPLDRDSVEYLTRMFKRLGNPTNPNDPNYPWTFFPNLSDTSAARSAWVDWNGDGVNNFSGNTRGGIWILQGDQCLVFFLGGIPTGNPNGTLGFSTNPSNPAMPGGDRLGPFYEFKSDRLVPLHGNTFFSYLDAYKKAPYAYFSSYKNRNGYNRYMAATKTSDCPLLGVWPYCESTSPSPRYANPDTFQIISAGEDGKFGMGSKPPDAAGGPYAPAGAPGWPESLWTPKTSGLTAASGPMIENRKVGQDDQCNFHDRLLGTPRN